MKKSIIWMMLAGGIGVAACIWAMRVLHPGAVEAGPLSDEITYLCRETGALIRGPREPGPEGIDAGDCQSLVQALYCPTCRAWYPMPSPEVLARMPMGPRCPKDRTGLLEEILDAEAAVSP